MARILLVFALGLTFLLAACGKDEATTPPATTPRVLVDERPPKPTPLAPNPEKRKFDDEGNLIESVNDLFGFRLPMGVKKARQDAGSAVVRIVSKMGPLVRFYTSRGYQVIEGKAGYTVRHSRATLEGMPNAERLAEATLYLRDAVGRRSELLFHLPVERKATPQPPVPGLDTPPPADAPAQVRETYERAQKWKEAHPGEDLPY